MEIIQMAINIHTGKTTTVKVAVCKKTLRELDSNKYSKGLGFWNRGKHIFIMLPKEFANYLATRSDTNN